MRCAICARPVDLQRPPPVRLLDGEPAHERCAAELDPPPEAIEDVLWRPRWAKEGPTRAGYELAASYLRDDEPIVWALVRRRGTAWRVECCFDWSSAPEGTASPPVVLSVPKGPRRDGLYPTLTDAREAVEAVLMRRLT